MTLPLQYQRMMGGGALSNEQNMTVAQPFSHTCAIVSMPERRSPGDTIRVGDTQGRRGQAFGTQIDMLARERHGGDEEDLLLHGPFREEVGNRVEVHSAPWLRDDAEWAR